jgi:ABC-type uncharacterized transport system ATPase subunit
MNVIQMEGITKNFPGVIANDRIDFAVQEAEIHGLLGENGAGKTVLMSILYGLLHPDAGRIFIKGKEAEDYGPAQAIKFGLGMVHQSFKLIPSFTVAENIVLGIEPTRGKLLLNRERMVNDVKEISDRYRLNVDPKARVDSLPVGVQQRVEILKALYRGADVLIMDEPTSVLIPSEVEELFKALLALKRQGKTVIFISHKLKEVLAICDRVTVLRGGSVVGTVRARDTDMERLVMMMVGRKVVLAIEKGRATAGRVVLKADDLRASNDRGLPALRGVDLEIRESEILGIAGVEGNGQTELVEVLMGLRKADGKVFLENEDISGMPTQKRIEGGIANVPEDRGKRGLIDDFSVSENLILGSQDGPPFAKWLRTTLDVKRISAFSRDSIKDFSIKAPSEGTPVRHLSGGNQQRVVLAREFRRKPKLIIASQPTRGLDVGATEYVRKRLVEMRDQGCAVLLISVDLDEILTLSDRIAVIYEGRIVATKPVEGTDERELGLLMGGGKRD